MHLWVVCLRLEGILVLLLVNESVTALYHQDRLTYRPLFVRKLQIHRQKVAGEQQKATKRRAPPAPTLPSLSSARPAAEAGTETSMCLWFCSVCQFTYVSIS